MTKTKALLGFAMMVGLLAVSVAPASAWFQSANGVATSGTGSAGVTVFTDEEASVECQKAEGGWQIQEFTKQAPVALGQHLLISTSKWNECTAFGIKSEVKPCQLQLIQVSKGQTTGVLGSVVTECVVKAAGLCEIKIAPSTENTNLKSITLANSGANQEDKANVTGIKSTATGFCVGIKNLTNANSSEKGIATMNGEKEV